MKIRLLFTAAFVAAASLCISAKTRSAMYENGSTIFTTAEAARVGEQIIAYRA